MPPDGVDAVMRYGATSEQLADVRLPRTNSPRALVLLVHGGFWRQEYDRHHTDPIAADLARRGYAVASLEYRRLGGAGGWPETFDDLAAAVDQVPGLIAALSRTPGDGSSADPAGAEPPKSEGATGRPGAGPAHPAPPHSPTLDAAAPDDSRTQRPGAGPAHPVPPHGPTLNAPAPGDGRTQRQVSETPERVGELPVVLLGHSAGGHLALWAASRHQLPPSSRWHLRQPPAVAGVVALAPVADVARAYELDLDDGAAAELLGGPGPDWAARMAQADVKELPPAAPVVIVHGDLDRHVPLQLSNQYAVSVRARAADVVLDVVVGCEHFALIDPASTAWERVLSALQQVTPAR